MKFLKLSFHFGQLSLLKQRLDPGEECFHGCQFWPTTLSTILFEVDCSWCEFMFKGYWRPTQINYTSLPAWFNYEPPFTHGCPPSPPPPSDEALARHIWHVQAKNNTTVIRNKRQENWSWMRPLRTADRRWIYLLSCLCMPMSEAPANQ